MLSHFPERFAGKAIRLSGKVIQSIQDGNDYTLRVNVTRDGNFWKDTMLVNYRAPAPSPRIVEGDFIDMGGVSTGIQSYKTILGATVQIPHLIACEITRPPSRGRCGHAEAQEHLTADQVGPETRHAGASSGAASEGLHYGVSLIDTLTEKKEILRPVGPFRDDLNHLEPWPRSRGGALYLSGAWRACKGRIRAPPTPSRGSRSRRRA
jgi:hypothetical protein